MNRFYRELTQALSCYERALFFAINTHAIEDPTIFDPEEKIYGRITRIYIASGLLLATRLKSVSEKYIELAEKLEFADIQLADRDRKSMIDTQNMVIKRWLKLVENSLEELKSPELNEISLEDISDSKRIEIATSCNWEAIHDQCFLLMDEILYLCNRVNELQDLIIAHEGLEHTRASINWAVWGIAISALLTLISIVLTIIEPKDVSKSDPELLKLFQKLEQRLSDLPSSSTN